LRLLHRLPRIAAILQSRRTWVLGGGKPRPYRRKTIMSKQTFAITGMDCAECAKTIERGVAKLDGVTQCTLNYGSAKLQVEGEISPEAVQARVEALGYGVGTKVDGGPKTEDGNKPSSVSRPPSFFRFLLSRRDTQLALVGAILVLPSLIFHELLPFLGVDGLWLDVTALAALIVAGWPVARSAWRALRINHEIGINLLMTIAAVGAVVIGAYTEAGLVMVLFAIGEALEGYTSERARASIRSLMQIAPNEATVLRPCIDCKGCQGKIMDNGQPYRTGPCPFCGIEEQRISTDVLHLDDIVVVKPGERIPMDGRIDKGASAINQAPITGESVPVDKGEGDEVFAGSINGEHALEIRVTRLAQDNTINRMIRLIEEAQERKAPAERFVDQFARYYTPIVVVLAILVAAIPPLLFAQPFWGQQGWLYRALALLVVACPCALVISTPVSLISALSNAARNGVLIKGGAALETLAKINRIAFDKTGTLTIGQPRVVEVRSVNCATPNETQRCGQCDDLLSLANAVERRSEHPLAKAVVAAAETNGNGKAYSAAESVQAMAGKGVRGQVDGHEVVIGSHAYFDQQLPHDAAVCAQVNALAANGQTPMLVGRDQQYMGYIAIADALRPSSTQAVSAIKDLQVQTLMLTGDNAAVAKRIATQVGVDNVRAELLPEDKLNLIQREMATPNARVAMVGDGINDAPALAAASLGIAMGSGSAQAMETADVTLMGNDLAALPRAIQLARRAMQTIKANIALAIGIKVAFLVLVLLGLGSLWLAVFADVGVSILVTLNGMRLLKDRVGVES